MTPWRDPRTGLAVYRPLQRRTRLRAVSKKRAAALVLYKRKRERFLTEHPFCEFPLGCQARADVIHHRRGRFTPERLNDERFWAASCNFHNEFAEMETGAALDCAWLLKIEGVEPPCERVHVIPDGEVCPVHGEAS